jgi:hypothetical protein
MRTKQRPCVIRLGKFAVAATVLGGLGFYYGKTAVDSVDPGGAELKVSELGS